MKRNHALFWSLLVIVSGTLGGGAAQAQEWVRFRGPNGAGISDAKSIPVKFSKEDYLWKAPLPGAGHSSPVIWGEKLFLTSAQQEGRKRHLFCLDTGDGSITWKRTVDLTTHRKHVLNSYASGSPTVDAERVYATFVSPEHYLVKVHDHDGELVWEKDLGPWESQHGHGASPILHGDKLILTNDQLGESFVVALDRKTGDEIWRSPRQSNRAAYGTPCILDRDGQPPELLLTSAAHGISSLDPGTGKMNWQAPLFNLRSVSSPVVYDKRLVFGTCGSGRGGNYLVAVKVGGQGDVSETHLAYKKTVRMPYVPTPVVYNDLLFLWSDKGIATCLEAETGEEVWQERTNAPTYGSPVCIDGKLYCISVDGEVVVLRAAREFEVLARNQLGDGSHGTPVVVDGKMYLRTFSSLICVGGEPAS